MLRSLSVSILAVAAVAVAGADTEAAKHHDASSDATAISPNESPLLRAGPDPSSLGAALFAMGKHHSKRLADSFNTIGATIRMPGACPEDFTLVDGNICERRTNATLECEMAFDEVDENFPGVTSNFVVQNRTCVRLDQEIEPSVSCQTGELNGIDCLEFEAIAPDFIGCEAGFVLTLRGCERELALPAGTAQCSPGQQTSEDGTQCLEFQAIAGDRTCAAPAFLGDDGITCVTRTAAGAPLTSCPAGFEELDDNCQQVESAKSQPSCAEQGGDLVNGECITFETAAAERSCPTNYTLGGNECVGFTSQAPTFSCPPSFTAINDFTCELIDRAAPEYTCGVQGAVYDAAAGQCVLSQQGPAPTLTCASGAVERNGQCFFITAFDAEISCADGFLVASGSDGAPLCQRCVALVGSGDAIAPPSGKHGHSNKGKHHAFGEEQSGSEDDGETTTNDTDGPERRLQEETPEGEPRGKAPPKATATGHHHHTGKGGSSTADGGDQYACDTVEATLSCPTGSQQAPSDVFACEALEAAAGDLVCPDTFDLVSGECVERSFSGATASCPQSGFELQNGECVQVLQQPKETNCPPASTLADNLCLNVAVTLAPDYSCPEGNLQGSECTIKIAAPAGTGCPSGYSAGVNGECQKSTLVPTQKTCPDANTFLENGECFSYPGEPSSLSCPAGATIQNGECFSLQAVGSPGVCPPGFTLLGTECTQLETRLPAIECPPGAIVSDDGLGCLTPASVASDVVCPDAFLPAVLQGQNAYGCFAVLAPNLVCPPDTTLEAGEVCLERRAVSTGTLISGGTTTHSKKAHHGSSTKSGHHAKKQ